MLADGCPCFGVESQNEVVLWDARHVNRSQNQKKFQEAVYNCAHTLVVLGFVYFRHLSCVPFLRGFSHTVSFCQVFMCTRVCLPQGPLSLCLRSFL